jgi:hypothetical protein
LLYAIGARLAKTPASVAVKTYNTKTAPVALALELVITSLLDESYRCRRARVSTGYVPVMLRADPLEVFKG